MIYCCLVYLYIFGFMFLLVFFGFYDGFQFQDLSTARAIFGSKIFTFHFCMWFLLMNFRGTYSSIVVVRLYLCIFGLIFLYFFGGFMVVFSFSFSFSPARVILGCMIFTFHVCMWFLLMNFKGTYSSVVVVSFVFVILG